MTEAIERLKRARERYGESHKPYPTLYELIELNKSRGWEPAEEPWWTNKAKNRHANLISGATDIERELDTAELIAAVDAVVKGETDQPSSRE